MSRMILVPIDISDKEFTERIISHVESEARIDDAEVHFLSVIPSLPYYASLGMAYTAELPVWMSCAKGRKRSLKSSRSSSLSRKIGNIFTLPKGRQRIRSRPRRSLPADR